MRLAGAGHDEDPAHEERQVGGAEQGLQVHLDAEGHVPHHVADAAGAEERQADEAPPIANGNPPMALVARQHPRRGGQET
jgi:hypothetical protein